MEKVVMQVARGYLPLVVFVGILVGLLFLISFPIVSADKGMFSPVSPYEPGQKAIIAWDGENEVLILSTDVYANESSWALEVLPLPSEPTVTGGDQESFESANSLLGSHVNSVRRQEEFKRTQISLAMVFTTILAGFGASIIAIVRMKVPIRLISLIWIIAIVPSLVLASTYSVSMGPVPAGGVDTIFHEIIGAHDITVVRSDNAEGLVSWAENFLDNKGIAFELSATNMENLTSKYIENGIDYFVFDLVDLGQERWSIDPIVYKFKSDFLYYPLEISSAASGSTEITIITITDGGLEKQQIESSGLSIRSAGEISLEFDVSKEQIDRLGSDVAGLFDGSARLTTLTYTGPLEDLSGDLKVSVVGGAREIESDVSYVIFWALIGCLWAIIIIFTYQIIRSRR